MYIYTHTYIYIYMLYVLLRSFKLTPVSCEYTSVWLRTGFSVHGPSSPWQFTWPSSRHRVIAVACITSFAPVLSKSLYMPTFF